jgi:hypothetical protein
MAYPWPCFVNAQQQLFDALLGALYAGGRYPQYTYSRTRTAGAGLPAGARLGITFATSCRRRWTYQPRPDAS